MILLPNFLIAGGVASGTSFLSAALAQHPEIYLPRVQRPEPNFFHYSWKYEQGIEWYQYTFFADVGQAVAVGERSSLLLHSDVAPQRIARDLPGIKLIFCLRNPVDRTWAHYRFTALEGLEPLGFDEALSLEKKRIANAVGRWREVQPHAYVSRSRYVAPLARYLELFGTEQILLLKSEELNSDPVRCLGSVCAFLGIGPLAHFALPPNYTSPSVVDPTIQVELRRYFGDKFSLIIECLRQEEDLSKFIRTNADARCVDQLSTNLRAGKNRMPEASRIRVRQLLQEETEALQSVLTFTVEDWR